MKRYILIMMISGVTLLSSVAQTHYVADLTKSSITWVGKKVMGEHTGKINFASGAFILDDAGKLSSVNFQANMNSITSTDITDTESNAKLIGHLKSDDFFSVVKYPLATFEIKQPIQFVKGVGVATVTGNLTIKGITNPLTFKAVVTQKEGLLYIRANAMIDRTKYNIQYGSSSYIESLGDNLIYDEFFLTLNIVAKKK